MRRLTDTIFGVQDSTHNGGQDGGQDTPPPDGDAGQDVGGEADAPAEEPSLLANMEEDPVGFVQEIFTNPELGMQVAQSVFFPAIKIILIFFIAWIIGGWLKKLSIGAMTRARIEQTVSKFLGNLVRWAVLVLAIIAILGVFGIPTASFAVVIGAMGLAIGLALQGTLGNAASGFLLLVFRPYKVGDVVNVGGITGKVFEIELFTTSLDTPDNRRIIMPNGNIFGATIENITHHGNRRVDVQVGISYDASIEETRRVLNEAVGKVDNVLTDPAPAVVLGDLGDSAVNWTVRVWSHRDNFWGVKEALTASVKNSLDAAGISIPYPQMDVHLRKQE